MSLNFTAMHWPFAAFHCSVEPPRFEASKILDVAVCCHPPSLFHFDDNITVTWAVPNLVELDIHHHSQHFCLVGVVFSGKILPCFCKGTGTTQATCKVLVHQRDCFLQLLAGNFVLLYSLLVNWVQTPPREYQKVYERADFRHDATEKQSLVTSPC